MGPTRLYSDGPAVPRWSGLTAPRSTLSQAVDNTVSKISGVLVQVRERWRLSLRGQSPLFCICFHNLRGRYT